jgi:two-component system response regulator YesN
VQKVLAQRILLPGNATVQYTPDFEPAFAIGDLISFKTRNDLRLAISALDEEQLSAVIRGVQTALTHEARVAGGDWQAAYFELIRLFLASTLDCGMQPPAGLEQELKQRYDAAGSAAELFSGLTERLVSAMMDWQVGKSAEESRPIRIARKFIHQHYAEPLTLQMLSDHVSLNATYFFQRVQA